MPNALWFSLNRERGGPAYQWAPNRTPATFRYNAWFIGVLVSAGIFLVILAILSPTLKHKLKTALLVGSSLFLGVIFILSSVMPDWQTGYAIIEAPLSVHVPRYYRLRLGVHVGLHCANITLQNEGSNCAQDHHTDPHPFLLRTNHSTQQVCDDTRKKDINFNERIYWKVQQEMVESLNDALRRGLPGPILTVFDYFQHQDGSFCWARDFRTAGYYAHFVLMITISSWVATNVLFLVIPRYGAISLIVTGILAIAAVLVYWSLLPSNQLVIHINGGRLQLEKGWCYWAVLVMGIAASLGGAALLWVDHKNPGHMTTDLQLEQQERLARLSQKKQEKENPKKPLKSKISVLDGTANVDHEKPDLEKMRDARVFSDSALSSTSLIHPDRQSVKQANTPTYGTTADSSEKHRSFSTIDESPIPHYSGNFLYDDQNLSDDENFRENRQGRDPFILHTVSEEDDEGDPSSSSSSSSDSGESDWGNTSSNDGDFPNGRENELHAGETIHNFPGLLEKITPRRRSARLQSVGSHQDFLSVR